MASHSYVCSLSPALKEKAKKELLEKEEWRDRDIHALRERVLKNKGWIGRIRVRTLRNI